MKKLSLALCLALCLTALGGCAFRQVDELYTLPKLPGDYQNLQSKIEEVTTGTHAEYSAPIWGGNTQPVQFQDLDGDGTLEALAFFKVTGDERPLKIYIFRLIDDGYEIGAVIEGEGDGISTIEYKNLNSTKAKELVVNWQKSKDVYTLGVYSVDRFEVVELMNAPHMAYELLDINMDNQEEIMLINIDSIDGTKSRVDCYAANKASLEMVSSAPLSQGIIKLDPETSTKRKGNLEGETPIPALFVTSDFGENRVVTDIFAWKNKGIQNITISAETGVSNSTSRDKDKARPTDIDGDNVLELPVPVKQRSPATVTAMPTLDEWYQYDIDGNTRLVCTTYHDFVDSWYFVLPNEWKGKVTVTSDTSVTTEKRTIFWLWQGEKMESFLTIYKLTGPNRYMRSRLGERFTLMDDDTTIYCAEFTPGGWDSGLDKAGVTNQFKVSQTDWTS